MSNEGFEYEIAFSFLQQDEALAERLADLLRDRFKVFLYSEQQKELAGKDGEIVFNDVFGKKARLVVVLYRKGWGDARWTQVEQTAIRNRAFEKNYDFTLFIPVEPSQGVPDWVPKNRIWVNLERWGIEAAASNIEERVKDAGGTPTIESAVEYEARISREAKQARELEALFNSHAGVQIADKEFKVLCDEIVAIAKEMSLRPDGRRIETAYDSDGFVARLCNDGFRMSVCLAVFATNTLQDSSLLVEILWTRITVSEGSPSRQTDELFSGKYLVKFSAGQMLSWQETGASNRRYTSKTLADYLMKEFSRLLIETHKR